MPEQARAPRAQPDAVVDVYRHVSCGLVAVLHAEPTRGYFALIPAIPGCGSQGDTPDETLANLDDALTTVLDVIREDEPERLRELCGEAPPGPAAEHAAKTSFVRCCATALRL
jgi:predicted RNase H-like HicB family nuclease